MNYFILFLNGVHLLCFVVFDVFLMCTMCQFKNQIFGGFLEFIKTNLIYSMEGLWNNFPGLIPMFSRLYLPCWFFWGGDTGYLSLRSSPCDKIFRTTLILIVNLKRFVRTIWGSILSSRDQRSKIAFLRNLHLLNFVFNCIFLSPFILQPNFLALKVYVLSN